MKIIFLCGSLEPGRDGVGDYTRRLTGELLRQKHQASINALQDNYIEGVLYEKQEQDNTEVSVIRLGKGVSAKKKCDEVSKFVNNLNPDWLSLQYVPFSYQKNGLPFFLGKYLKKIGAGRKWHIMFHELWVGMDKEAPWKHKIWGKGQAYIVRKIIEQLNPVISHTQTPLYKMQLDRIGHEVSLLPLFGNIPVHFSKNGSKEGQTISFVVFGQIQPGAPIEQFAKELRDYGQDIQKEIQFIFIGHNGKELKNWVEICIKANFRTILYGEQDVNRISKVLSEADWGITSTPSFQLEKSGTVAAMIEHDLPIYCVARPWNTTKVPKIDIPGGIIEYRINELDLSVHKNGNVTKNRLENVARSLVYDLS